MSGSAKKLKPRGGSRKGRPNKATADARAAIALFVDHNAHRLQGWLDAVAEGVKAIDEEGKETYIVPPKPQTAFELFQSIVEYHVPKLQRTDIHADLNAKTEALVQISFAPGPKSET